jgi:hypothetical protein
MFCWAELKNFKNNSAAYEKNFRLRDKNHAPFKLNGKSRTAFGLLKAPELQRLSVSSAIVFKVFQLGPTKHSLQKKILFHVDLIKMLSLIPVIFSSKFRITKIHVLPFQVIKSSHS